MRCLSVYYSDVYHQLTSALDDDMVVLWENLCTHSLHTIYWFTAPQTVPDKLLDHEIKNNFTKCVLFALLT